MGVPKSDWPMSFFRSCRRPISCWAHPLDESGLHESLIVTKIDDSTRSVIDFVGPKRVLVMSISDTLSLSSAKIGIAFEYGRDQSETTYRETLRGIMRIRSASV